ncbi:MAG: hypothetical protein FWD97_09995 [Defluviitaleaceae bacterium]|nr:hypothetical protein [Defluviitaleaceae bacterium]
MAELGFEEFFVAVNDEHKGFVNEINDIVTKENYTIIKVTSTKTNPFKVSYAQPKTRLGIVNFYLRKKSFKMMVSAKNCGKYPDVLGKLPEDMVSQLDKSSDCLNLKDPGKCMEKCSGYDFHIGDTHYQKCRFGCFQFDVTTENTPFLLEMVERELTERNETK